jgi:hypothetical protein
MLEQQPKANETATTVMLRQSGEHATLATVSKAVSAALSRALGWHAWWVGSYEPNASSDEPAVALNTDFMDMTLTAQEVQALMAMWQGGGISYETFYYNLQRGEWARPNITVEDEKDAIAAEEDQAEADRIEAGLPLPGEELPPEEGDDGEDAGEDGTEGAGEDGTDESAD